ncbi:MAG TPA: helix-turn-helix domain-containing protein [Terriglobales bacterium]|nr:helix-turn-helix domain-containing protein [Terriglobales bacterium]
MTHDPAPATMERTSVRRRVLEALKRHGPGTATELAQRLGGGPVAMRAHLRELLAAGLVEDREERRAVGRPVRRYRLSPRAESFFPRQYERFAVALIEDLEDDPALDGILSRWEDQLFAHLDRRLPASGRERAEALAAHQDGHGFMASAEWRPKAVTLIERNCPILEIARRRPQVCRHEAALFGRLLRGRAELPSCQALGDAVCMFRITPADPPPTDASTPPATPGRRASPRPRAPQRQRGDDEARP